MKKIKYTEKYITAGLSCILFITSISCIPYISFSKSASAEEPESYGLNNPRIAYYTRDIIEFGHYWQEDTNGDGKADENDQKTPIRWRVLENNGDELFLLADKVLDCQYYNNTSVPVTWEQCSLRTWLNNDFYNSAFSVSEKNGIIESDVINSDNPKKNTNGGNDTKDYLFLLSLDEIKNHGINNIYSNGYKQYRQGKATAYAKDKERFSVNIDDACTWWLRSPGWFSNYVSYVRGDGYVSDYGDGVVNAWGIRPALRINRTSVSEYVRDAGKDNVEVKATSWDTVSFGTYKGNELTWRVLNISGNEAFLLSENVVQLKLFNENRDTYTWKNSTIRTWLNNDFLNSAFNSTQKSAIVNTLLENNDNPYSGVSGGDDTADKIFLLSLSDVSNPEYGFPDAYDCSSEARQAFFVGDSNSDWWWLRSPGYDSHHAAGVCDDGRVHVDGSSIFDDMQAVRPALRINLSLSGWTKGEKVFAGDKTLFDRETISNPQVSYLSRNLVRFGHYWQEDTNHDGVADMNDDKTPIRWQVLEENGDELLLMSDKILDAKRFNNIEEATSWENSALREWLNSTFYNSAFSTQEKTGILGNDTSNNNALLLLSLDEVTKYGFNESYTYKDQARQGELTPFVIEKGLTESIDGTGFWWLRSPGKSADSAAVVRYDGEVYDQGEANVLEECGVRPVIKINMSALQGLASEVGKKSVAVTGASWDTILFGSYGGNILTWRVLDVNGDDALILSENIIEKKRFNNEYGLIPWKDCSLRKWLNEDFYNIAFDSSQKEAVIYSLIENAGNTYYGMPDEDSTSDRIYLLSLAEISNTAYGFPGALCCGNNTRSINATGGNSDGYWWLRSYGSYKSRPAYVNRDGSVDCFGDDVNYEYDVRPVLHIDLTSSSWTKGDRIIVGSTDYSPKETPGPTSTPVPTACPTETPTLKPTETPTATPTVTPTATPTITPTETPKPTGTPTAKPTDVPATPNPTINPTIAPTIGPIVAPDVDQSSKLTVDETQQSTGQQPAVQGQQNTTQTNVSDKTDIKKGKTFFSGNVKYKITSLKAVKYEVSVIGVKNKKCKKIKIEGTVTYKGMTFYVTSLGKRFAAGCKKVKTIIINSKHIKKIDKNAFSGIKSKHKVYVPKSMVSMYKKLTKK